MDLDFNNVNISATSSEILAKVSEFDIFKRYINNFYELERSFCSELREDANPSCRITGKYDKLYYRDFGTGESYDCWNYVMRKFSCNYYEALNIIANDFGIHNIKVDISPRIILSNDNIRPLNIVKLKSKLEIVSQPWTIQDYDYWNQYLINFELLDKYSIVSAKHTILYKENSRYIFEYNKTKPRYGYLFKNGVKAYSPYGTKLEKWMFTCWGEVVEGLDQLDDKGDVLIITKGLKDVINYRVLGINAVALPSETSKLKKELLDYLYTRFTTIIINLDNDSQGIESTNKITAEFGLKSFYTKEQKDLSDWIKVNRSIDKANIMINEQIENCLRY